MTRTKSALQHAMELDRELRESGASGVEVVDVITDAFSDELSRLAAYRGVYRSSVAQRLRQAKAV